MSEQGDESISRRARVPVHLGLPIPEYRVLRALQAVTGETVQGLVRLALREAAERREIPWPSSDGAAEESA